MAVPPGESTYQVYFDEAPIGIFEVNADGEYVAVNDAGCELVGYSERELLEMTIGDLAVEADTKAALQLFSELRDTDHTQAEVTVRHRDGHEIDVLLEAVAFEDDRYVAYVQDVTTQKEYQRLLVRQRDNLEVLNQMLRHDIRNDLQLVTGYADLLAEQCEDEDLREYISTIQQSVSNAVGLTSTVRDLANVMLSVTQKDQRIVLSSVLEDEVEKIRAAYPDASVVSEGAFPSVAVQADEMLDSVFRNLLKNAVQHNDKEAPEVSISVTEETDRVTVRIADNGPGISDQQKETIFQEGERGFESSGTGIGLYLVETIVRSYGGEVFVEDNDPEGLVFVVRFIKAK